MKVALIVIAGLGAMLLFLLTTASANTALFSGHYSLLLAFNAISTVLLLGLVMVQVRALRRDYRRGLFGSRLKWRLVVMLVLMAVLPGVLVYAVSMQFAVRSIESWFDVRVDSAIEGGLNLGRSVLDTMQADLLEKARNMALDLADAKDSGLSLLNRRREQAGVQEATLFSASGQVLANSSGELTSLMPVVPSGPTSSTKKRSDKVSSFRRIPSRRLKAFSTLKIRSPTFKRPSPSRETPVAAEKSQARSLSSKLYTSKAVRSRQASRAFTAEL